MVCQQRQGSVHRLLIVVIGLNILPNAKGHLRTRLSPETWINAWAINRDMGQCMGCQQGHGSMHGLSAETWVNAWAVNRHGSMHGLHGLSTETWVSATIGGSCHKFKFLSQQKFLFCHYKHICFVTKDVSVTTNMRLSQPTHVCRNKNDSCGSSRQWYNAWAVNRHGSVPGLSTDTGQCLGWQQTWVNARADKRHGPMHGLTTDMGPSMCYQQT